MKNISLLKANIFTKDKSIYLKEEKHIKQLV